ncbi:MAG: TusE/DsrC/DsvC family sulfur relay protein [Thiolinea sp.]
MQTVTDKSAALDNEGFLLDPDDWTEEWAESLALEQELELTQERNEIILFIRDFYERNASVPEARKVLKYMKHHWGAECATRKYLYGLFPHGYGQQACKLAGMRKPLKLMLDI